MTLQSTIAAARRHATSSALPILCAFLLVIAGAFLAWQSERRSIAERADQASVQARITAAALSGALAFDDGDAVREYLAALQLNPGIQAAAVYAHDSKLLFGFHKDQAPLPGTSSAGAPIVDGLSISVSEPVRQGGLELGTVYIKASIEPLATRLSRYLAVSMMIVFAAVLILLFGRAVARTSLANLRLREEISARQKAERALVQAQKMEAIGHLTGGIAHDFNNLLMAASSGVELLDRTEDPAKRERLKQGVREALDRGAKITRQLLSFARRSPVRAETIDVANRLHSLDELLSRSLRENISVQYDFTDDLWPVFADATQFDVAIVNIAVNARDAMPNGGRITISATNQSQGLFGSACVSIDIADEGCGIAPEILEKVFDPFFTTKPVGMGTGLGLSQVYGFIQACGGDITIKSSPAAGTAVTMRLPRHEMTDQPRASTNLVEVLPLAHKRVLIVEDDPRIAEAVCAMAQELGLTALRAGDAEQALKVIKRHAVDFVLSDMLMPGKLNGLELARRLQNSSPSIPVVLMTGYSPAAQSAVNEGLRLLYKPFNLNDLRSVLAKVGGPTAPPPAVH